MRLHLSGPQLMPIRTAIVSAYIGAGASALELLNKTLSDYIEGKTVFEYVSINTTFELQVGQLLARANGEGWLPSLLGAVRGDRPDREDLQELLRSVLATVPAVAAVAVATGSLMPEAVKAELQQLLPGSALVAPETMQRRMRAVCRIEYADQIPAGGGTGFLVGSDLVLTNWHVIRRVIDAPGTVSQLRFRFDLFSVAAAADSGGRVANAADKSPAVLWWRPAGGVELSGGRREPSKEELDYALVRLSEPVGNDVLPDTGGRRGHMPFGRAAPEPVDGSTLMILQHPLRGELQFALGTILGRNDTGSRLLHSAATQHGSSGSPVLDAELGLIALHNGARFGSPRAVQAFNTAVPVRLIGDDLVDAGLAGVLQN